MGLRKRNFIILLSIKSNSHHPLSAPYTTYTTYVDDSLQLFDLLAIEKEKES